MGRDSQKTEDTTEKLVNIISISYDQNVSLKDHWDKMQESTAKCNLEEFKPEDLNKTAAVAVFIYSMRNSNIIGQVWEK